MSNDSKRVSRQHLFAAIRHRMEEAGEPFNITDNKLPARLAVGLPLLEVPGQNGESVGTYNVVVNPSTPKERPHRVLISCPCGRLIPYGRWAQHACKAASPPPLGAGGPP